MGIKTKDLTGERFGRLTVIGVVPGEKGKQKKWECVCDCGNKTEVVYTSLMSGNTQSCGCLKTERLRQRCTTHNMRHKRLYSIWCDMRKRCKNESEQNYYLYGGRGIEVCDEWQKFEPFKEWAYATGYNDSLTIDRINPNGNYEPSNCKWSDLYEQANNKRNNVKLSYNGQTKTVAEWSRAIGIKAETIYWRIHKGWTPEKALTTPPHRTGKNKHGREIWRTSSS